MGYGSWRATLSESPRWGFGLDGEPWSLWPRWGALEPSASMGSLGAFGLDGKPWSLRPPWRHAAAAMSTYGYVFGHVGVRSCLRPCRRTVMSSAMSGYGYVFGHVGVRLCLCGVSVRLCTFLWKYPFFLIPSYGPLCFGGFRSPDSLGQLCLRTLPRARKHSWPRGGGDRKPGRHNGP